MVEPLRLGEPDAGELLTLQRASYVTEAQAHGDLFLPPLTETLDELRSMLLDSAVFAWGIRESGRLVAGVRILVRGETGEVGRLVVAPDRQRHGLGRTLLLAAEDRLPPAVTTLRLFTGEHSTGPLRLYPRLGYRETGRTQENGYQLVHFTKVRSASRP
ncbi:GNAT family N-acetyltransferase [Amycolatopsis cynarae]|uniref:GNAT family N-acetyltransferase n=1 Tax=Amycolatopsis cynarae TaxID=2995223 RepID=A0ABY7B2A3_9PSEU|nr:GNAT family N-acetyltransferase [Amycolatopsis sp. HUAS 11-8]WAL66336.1 GNAT family N-acetyltransferase [Amycolatopsis sp. HUAS 11-8]